MRYLLDTNVCVRFLNGESERLRQRFFRTDRQDIAVCSVVKAELFYGAMRSNNPTLAWARQRQFLEAFISLPLDDFAALIAGRVRAQLANECIAVVSFALFFLVNGVRVALMAVLVALSDGEAFEYWHLGDGSLIFSAIAVFSLALIYNLIDKGRTPEAE